jgi:hypothetical protein
MFRLIVLVAVVMLAADALFAAPPKVNYFSPTGGQRGQTVSITANGEFSTWPVKVWADRPGVSLEAEQDKGKFRATIAADAVPGIVWLRAYNDEGGAPLRPFVVGSLPEVSEAEPNDGPHKPQSLAENVVVSGKLAKNGDVDGYKVKLKQGRTLVAALQGNSVLGSPMDAVVQICELVERRSQVEAYVVMQNHDAVGLDPLAIFAAQRDGDYLVRVFAFPSEPNSSINFSGGDNFNYRLTITSGGYIDHALPLATKRGETPEVKLFGWNLPADAAAPAAAIGDGTAIAAHGDYAGAVPLAIVEHASVVVGPQAGPGQPQQVDLPATLSGILSTGKEIDAVSFIAPKGMKLRIECESRSLGYPLMPRLRIADESGKQLAAAEATDKKRDAALAFTSPADGRYVLSIADLHGRGGDRFAYRLTIEEARPDFALSLAADSFVVTGDKPLEIPVTIDRRDGFSEAIDITAMELPSGVTAEPVISTAKGDSAKAVKLVLKGSGEAAAGSHVLRIVGTSGTIRRTAEFPLNLPMAGSHAAAWLTIRK